MREKQRENTKSIFTKMYHTNSHDRSRPEIDKERNKYTIQYIFIFYGIYYFQKMSVIVKIGTAYYTSFTHMYTKSVQINTLNTIEKFGNLYSTEREILLRKLPQDASWVFFVTQQEVDGIKKDVSTIINPIEVDSLSTNKDYTLRIFSLLL